MANGNLVQNPDFETTLTPWIQGATTGYTQTAFARSTFWAYSGTNSLRVAGSSDVTAGRNATAYAETVITGSSGGIPVTVGGVYRISAQINVIDAPGTGVRISCGWFDSGRNLLSTSTGTYFTGTGLRYLFESFTAPANAAYARPGVQMVLNASDTGDIYIDAVSMNYALVPTGIASLTAPSTTIVIGQAAPQGIVNLTAPSASISVKQVAPQGIVNLTASSPAVAVSQTVSAPAGVLALGAVNPVLKSDVLLQASAGLLTLTAIPPFTGEVVVIGDCHFILSADTPEGELLSADVDKSVLLSAGFDSALISACKPICCAR